MSKQGHDYYSNELLPAIFANPNQFFPEFAWRAQSGGWVATRSPLTDVTSHDRITMRMTGGAVPGGFCVQGSEPQLWTYYLTGYKPRGEEFWNVVEEICKRGNVPFVRELSPEQTLHLHARRRRSNLFDAFWALVREDIAPAQAYAETRGVPSGVSVDIGYIDDVKEVVRALSDFSTEELTSFGILGGRGTAVSSWSLRMVGKHTAIDGAVSGFWMRDLTGSAKQKYLNTSGTEIGFSNLHGHKGRIVLVEGCAEPTLFNAVGIREIVSNNGAAPLTKEKWQTLVDQDVKQVILAFDDDDAGDKCTDKSVENSVGVALEIFVMVMDPAMGCKDLGEMLQKHGIKNVEEAIELHEHVSIWRLRRAIDAHRGEMWSSSALARCAQAVQEIAADYSELQLGLYGYWDTAERLVPDLHGALEVVSRNAEKARKQQELKRAQTSLAEATTPGEFIAKLKDAQALAKSLTPQPVRLSTLELLTQRTSFIEQGRGGEKEIIGVETHSLQSLDQATCGLRGLVMVPAPPNVGKTALCLQMGIDAVKGDPDVCLLFISLEMPVSSMLDRVICNFAGVGYRTYRFGNIRGKAPEFSLDVLSRHAINTAVDSLGALSGRIEFIDAAMLRGQDCVSYVRDAQQSLKASSGCSKIVTIVDYVQLWPTPERLVGTERDLYRMQQMQGLVVSEDEPVLVISALAKASAESGFQNGLAQVLGSGINTYSPDMVLMVTPINDEDLLEWWNEKHRDDPIHEPPKTQKGGLAKVMKPIRWRIKNDAGVSYMKLEIAKGRDGVEQREIELTYDFRSNKFEEGWIYRQALDNPMRAKEAVVS